MPNGFSVKYLSGTDLRKLFKSVVAATPILVFALCGGAALATPINAPDCAKKPKLKICRLSQEKLTKIEDDIYGKNKQLVAERLKWLSSMDWVPNLPERWPEAQQKAYCESKRKLLMAGSADMFPLPTVREAEVGLKATIESIKRTHATCSPKFTDTIDEEVKDFSDDKDRSVWEYVSRTNGVEVRFDPVYKEMFIEFVGNKCALEEIPFNFNLNSGDYFLMNHDAYSVVKLDGDLFVLEAGLYRVADAADSAQAGGARPLDNLQEVLLHKHPEALESAGLIPEAKRKDKAVKGKDGYVDGRVIALYPLERPEYPEPDETFAPDTLPCTWLEH